MTPDRRQQVEEIFQAVLNQTPKARPGLVSLACGDDATLKHEVEMLLSAYETPGTVKELDTATSEWRIDAETEVDPMIGRRLGAYRIKREVARGGMGTVYEAVRVDNEFRKKVAIKIVKRGTDTDFVLRRFRKERQILAGLNHPNIASLLDGGTTDEGLPYFVMEYIEGKPLYNYCDDKQLSIAERLQLFLSICDSVNYAHQKQVVHRDLKPSNILVTDEGVPKLLDFGIAKLLNPDMVGDITRDSTGTTMRLMTPEYASPEQVQGLPTSPATDVYSLGVLLYELLTGIRPYRLVSREPLEIGRVICEEEPHPPSFVITRHDDLFTVNDATTLQRVYSARKTQPEVLEQMLSGELDTLVMCTLRKKPEDRYQSVGQLRNDIARYLAAKPISNWPVSAPTAPATSSAPTLDELVHKPSHYFGAPPAQVDLVIAQESISGSSFQQINGDTNSRGVDPATQSFANAREARQLYTAGHYYSTRRTAEGLWLAIDRLKQAVELDTKFALAHSQLADCYSLLNWYVEPPPADAWRLAKQSAVNAVMANPNLAEARASLGFVKLHYDRDWEGAERELRIAIRLKPSAQVAHRWLAFSLSTIGKHEEALFEMQRAEKISPQSAVLATAIANVLFFAGKYDEAISQCHRAMELDSGAVSVHAVLRWCYEKKGMHPEALAAFEQERVFAGDTPTTRLKRASVLAAVGRGEEARMILNDIIDCRQSQWVSAYEIAIVYCWLGDKDSAFHWLTQAEREHAIGFTFVRVDPRLEGLRSDSRFESLLRGIHQAIR